MEPEILKIEETVLDILKNADMDEMTEFKVRVAAAARLGIDLTDIHRRRFIRGVVESFLLSTTDPSLQEENQKIVLEEPKKKKKVEEFDSDGNRIICKLSNKRNVVIQDFKGKSYVSIREVYYKDGRQLPSNKGICLTAEQWSAFRTSVPLIEEAILKMQSKSRSKLRCEQNEQSLTASIPCGLIGHSSNVVGLVAASSHELNGQASNVAAASSHELSEQAYNVAPASSQEFNRQASNVMTSSSHELNWQASNVVTASCHKLNGKASNVATSSSHELKGQTSNVVTASVPADLNGQVSKSVSTTTTAHELNGQVSDLAAAAPLHEYVPIEINRFDGKNYQYWAPLMELFLKQLKIAYVLSDPCPSVAIRPEASAEEITQAKAAEQKWFADDYMCRRNILASLSDDLYYQYLKKTKSAKELWEELKLVYLYEEFGKKRSQVKKYIEFQIGDERSILDQVQELNTIADDIVAAGIFVDEKFHVSAIISKLPPSWKDFCIKLMCEEYLPFWMLMDRVKAEEESCRQNKQLETSISVCFNHAKNLGPRMKDMKKPGFNWKRREAEIDNKGLFCYFCGKKGHISKHCRSKKFDKEANEKLDKENSSAPAVTETKT